MKQNSSKIHILWIQVDISPQIYVNTYLVKAPIFLEKWHASVFSKLRKFFDIIESTKIAIIKCAFEKSI